MSWYDEGIERARKEGEREGRRKERRALLLRLLRMRFGELPAAVITRVEAADMDDLDVWAERIITSPTLDDVFGAA